MIYVKFTFFGSEGPRHYLLVNNTKIVLINQVAYQIILNDESNNFFLITKN